MYSYDSLFVKNIFLPSEIRIMNHCGSDKSNVCRNALQTSLIREKSGEELVADIAPEVDDEDIDLIKNNKVEDDDDEGVEVEYSYEDDELIDIAINDDEE